MGKLDNVVNRIDPIDQGLMEEAQKRLDFLTKPQGSLGRLEELAKKLVGITRERNPEVDKKVVVVMAGDHGVVDEGVSAYPQEVTVQMVKNFASGGAAINVMARQISARVVVAEGKIILRQFSVAIPGCHTRMSWVPLPTSTAKMPSDRSTVDSLRS